MSSTNKTLTIELSQYVGTDKPTYLSDYNGDMLKIDNAIAADRDSIATAQSKADGADAKADTNATAIQTLDGQVNNTSNGLTKRVTDVEGDVNTIESLIGNGTPTTTDKTIIGAINELNAEMPDSANLVTKTPERIAHIVADGVKTLNELLNELWSELDKSDKLFKSFMVYEGVRYNCRTYVENTQIQYADVGLSGNGNANFYAFQCKPSDASAVFRCTLNDTPAYSINLTYGTTVPSVGASIDVFI